MIMRFFVAALKRAGGAGVKRRIWDREFSSGKWNYLDSSSGLVHARDVILDPVDRYLSDGNILDLGCGVGSTGLEIANNYRMYTGVDISAVAVRQAESIVQTHPQRSARNKFVASDIRSFEPRESYTVILFRESIYYVPFPKIRTMLSRYSTALAENGVFIVRLHDKLKYKHIIEFIEGNFLVKENLAPEDGKTAILVFAPRVSA